ncbi:hypothetical protein Glove_648g9 [Diversispora epigaea]|uniref:Uncharacterized protein n=1 Tax=Diversispora epigaea TaxID=1348612 RepID=A0A397G7I2_9GLOM|nr:hypothetical protein Glove_648g9 [Diversispora epigaea]
MGFKSAEGKNEISGLSQSSIKNLNSIEDSNVKNYNCCVCWQKNDCIKICKKNFQEFVVNDFVNTIIQMTELDENAKEKEIWIIIRSRAFSTVWKAEWEDMLEEIVEIYNFNQLLADFHCRSKYVLPILGITQDPMTMEYAVDKHNRPLLI